jgi:hypothetical protein
MLNYSNWNDIFVNYIYYVKYILVC